MKTYAEKLRDPRWQRKRLEIMQRDKFTCTQCGNSKQTLNIHHWKYSKEPWNAKNEDLTTVCESCHEDIEDSKNRANDFLRQRDFRRLMALIENFIHRNGKCKVLDYPRLISILPEEMNKASDRPKSGMAALDAMIDAAPEVECQSQRVTIASIIASKKNRNAHHP